LGQWQNAQASIDTALRLNPEEEEFRTLAAQIGTRGPLGKL